MIKNISMKFVLMAFWVLVIFSCLYLPSKLNIFSAFYKDSINIYSWADVINHDAIKMFEKETGIKVNVSYYEQNYELFSKMELTKGAGYDLIVATDFSINFLKYLNLLKEIDKSKLDFWNNLEPVLLNKSFDPDNQHSIPYIWDIYVVGYNKTCFQDGNDQTLDVLFNPKKIANHITMGDEANEVISFAGQYKFGDAFDYSNKDQLAEVKKILINQKKYIEAYSDLRAGDMLVSATACAAICQSAYVYRAQLLSKDVDLFIPKPRTFIIIDSLMIPKSSNKDELVYKFLNYIYKPEILKKVSNKHFFMPARTDSLYDMNLGYLGGLNNLLNHASVAKSFAGAKYYKEFSRLWMEVRAY